MLEIKTKKMRWQWPLNIFQGHCALVFGVVDF